VVEGRYLRTCVSRRLALRRLALARLVPARLVPARLVPGLLVPGLLVLGACSAPLGIAQASAVPARVHARAAESTPEGRSAPGSAGLDQCVTAVPAAGRSATFSGEMTAIPGTVRMAMRIEVQERTPAEAAFHTITAPGLGAWRASEAKVKVYKYFKQVTNLHSPASYRALVRFRWLSARGRVLRQTERLTPRCLQPASPPSPPPGPEGGVEGTSTSSPPASG
jgi:hypothetical protein